jgi:hypothetical protein
MGIALLVVFGGIISYNLLKAFMIKRFFASYQPPAVSVASAIAQEVNWQPRLNAVVVSAGEIKLQNGTPVAINNNVHLNDSSNPALLGQ